MKRGFLVIASLVLAGAFAPASAERFRTLVDIRRDHVVVQKWELSCGAAAVATILAYQHDDPVPEREIVQSMLRRTDPMQVRYKGGFSWLDLKRYVESRGYEGVGYSDLDLDDLNDYAPMIVPIKNPASFHFVVVRGVLGDRVVLADPGWGNRTLSRKQFSDLWLDHLGFTVVRHDGRKPLNHLAVSATDAYLLPTDAPTQ